jgi:hypothetical protein
LFSIRGFFLFIFETASFLPSRCAASCAASRAAVLTRWLDGAKGGSAGITIDEFWIAPCLSGAAGASFAEEKVPP